MTVKEIALAVNKTERSVRNWVARTTEKSSGIKEKSSGSSPMKPADYTLDETIEIIETGLGKNASLIFRQNAEKTENKTLLTNRDMERIAVIVSKTVSATIKQLDNRITNIEQKYQEKNFLLPVLKDKRATLNQVIRAYQNRTALPYPVIWNRLYNEIYYRLHENVSVRAMNRNQSVLDYIEEAGLMPKALSVAIDLFQERPIAS